MAEIVNLRVRRKSKAREEKERDAAENRRRFGRKTAEKVRERAEVERAAREHAGRKIVRE